MQMGQSKILLSRSIGRVLRIHMCNGGNSEEILYVQAVYLYTPLRLCIFVANL